MNRYIKHLYLMSWVLFTIQVSGQVSLEASINKSEVPLNGSFSITFSLETDDSKASNSKINYPDLTDFDRIGTSTGYQMDMHTVIKSITYILRPIKEGIFQIGKANVTIDGKNYETQPLTITVTAASMPSQSNGNSQSRGNNNPKKGQYIPRSGEILDNDNSPNTKLLVNVSNLSPYVGQQVLLTLRLLTRDHNVLQNIGFSKQPQFKNFSWENYKIKNSHSQKENYKGKNYYSDIIFQAVISPQKAGKIPLEAFQIQVPYLIKTGERDFFGDFIERYILTKLNSNTLVFNVKPLPSKGKPADFSGAVGDFNLTTFLDKKSSNAGESVQLDIEVSGKGDFKMVKIPEINQIDSEALELYDPGTTKKITLTREGNKGKVSKNYIIVPQYKGEYKIPKLHFSYFNPITQRYETKTTDSKTLHIINGTEKPSKVLTEKNDTEIKEKKASEQALSNKIFLKPYKEELTIEKQPGLSEKALGLIILSVSLLTPLIIILLNILRRQKTAKKENYRRVIKKYMAQAQKYNHSEEIIPFYTAIEKSIYYNLKQKLKIQKADFDLLKIRITLKNKNVSRENIEKVYKIIQECNYQKYAPSGSKKSMKKIYEETADFIKNFKA